ncbi:MAG: hypothetical protein KC944_08840 [Candidatus Omnitrophica bacterium]|nr:hypothetical protein [Candidatus Omnitrophota bacterium]
MIEVLETYPRINLIHHVEPDGTVWGTSNRRILRKRREEDWAEVSRFPFAPPKDFSEVTRLTARASRVDQSNVYVNRHGKVIGIRNGVVYRIEENRSPVPLGHIQGDSILRRGFAEDEEGTVYFGEYFRNTERGPVRIWKVAPDASRVEVAYEFPANTLRHVHGVHADPHDPGVFWVTVGDDNGECFFYRTADRFQSMERFGEGTQTWRAVGLLFTPNHVCWLTDSHTETNHVCRMKRSDGSLEIGQEIDCSGWYSCTTKEGLRVAFTTVEKGPAITSNEASVLISPDGFNWKKAGSYKKDAWRPMKIFKYGVLACPSGEMSIDEFYLSGEGLAGLDGRSVRVRIGKDVL